MWDSDHTFFRDIPPLQCSFVLLHWPLKDHSREGGFLLLDTGWHDHCQWLHPLMSTWYTFLLTSMSHKSCSSKNDTHNHKLNEMSIWECCKSSPQQMDTFRWGVSLSVATSPFSIRQTSFHICFLSFYFPIPSIVLCTSPSLVSFIHSRHTLYFKVIPIFDFWSPPQIGNAPQPKITVLSELPELIMIGFT